MDESLISTNSRSKSLHSFADEESGWSFLEDFPACNSQTEESFLSGCETSSMVSDAASYWDSKKHHLEYDLCQSSETKRSKRSKCEHELEDTASSPLSSSTPLVNPNFFNLYNHEDEGIYFGIHKGKPDEIGKEKSCTPLGRKGLCLVPFSMFNCIS